MLYIKKYRYLPFFLMLSITTSQACTIWGVVGQAAQGGGLLIAKNRDNPPTGLETLKFHRANEKSPIAYLTLSYRCRQQLFKNAEVDHVLIGDSTELMQVEIEPHGIISIQRANKTEPYLFHTNTYESKNLTTFNQIHYKDSQIRYQRIKTLLRETQQPYTVNDFWRISYDRNAGANNSLFRDYTEATWIVKEPVNASPILYVRFTNPNQHYAAYQLKLDNTFWKTGQKKISTLVNKKQFSKPNLTID